MLDEFSQIQTTIGIEVDVQENRKPEVIPLLGKRLRDEIVVLCGWMVTSEPVDWKE